MARKSLLLFLVLLVAVFLGMVNSFGKDKGETMNSQQMYLSGAQESFKGPENIFTGEVQVDMLFPSNDTAHYSGAYVTFQPQARTAWHLHPAGQHMIVTAGIGLTGTRDGKIEIIQPKDAVWCPPNVEHWHGAAPDSPMTHLVISGELNGNNVIWKEKVTDEQYFGNIGQDTNNKPKVLSDRLQSMIPIAAFTAGGEISRLKFAILGGLEAGLTINEIKEIIVHLYAYVGFPRSLNALSAFMEVLDERRAAGINDRLGKEAGAVSPNWDKNKYGAQIRAKLAGSEQDISKAKWQLFSPIIDTFLKEHLFADIFVRDVLNHQERELVTNAALANMKGTKGQLLFHLKAAMTMGLSLQQMEDFITVLKNKVGRAQSLVTQKLLSQIQRDL